MKAAPWMRARGSQVSYSAEHMPTNTRLPSLPPSVFAEVHQCSGFRHSDPHSATGCRHGEPRFRDTHIRLLSEPAANQRKAHHLCIACRTAPEGSGSGGEFRIPVRLLLAPYVHHHTDSFPNV